MLKSVAAYWELLARSGKFLPEESSKYITEKQLLLIQANHIFTMDQSQVVFRVCVKPPRKLVLVQKLLSYLKELNLQSGIDLAKKNFPDKQWLILAIATVSQGKDEIFHRDYLPSKGAVENDFQVRYVPSEDPLFQSFRCICRPEAGAGIWRSVDSTKSRSWSFNSSVTMSG